MKNILNILLLSTMSLSAFTASNIQLLSGKFDGNSAIYDTSNGGNKSTLTYETFSANKVGDVFGFIDYTIADETMLYTNAKTTFYGELSPRLSLSYMSDSELSFDVLKDLYIASQVNVGSGADFRAGLLGLGLDVDVAGFNYFSLNLYYKHARLILPDPNNGFANTNVIRDTYQLSSAYGTEFSKSKFSFDGWFDLSAYSFQTQNQLLYDLYNNEDSSKFQVGVEHLYYYEIKDDFNTKYGSNRPISNTLQVMIKYKW